MAVKMVEISIGRSDWHFGGSLQILHF